MIRGLYLITDGNTDTHLPDKVKAALRGGASAVQYRAKGQPAERQIEAIRALLPLCREAGVPLIVNDSAAIARDSEADGVHLGQDDMTPSEARKLLGRNKIIGITCRTIEQALKAQMQGADYIGFGAIFPTSTKDDTRVVGLEALQRVRRAVEIPIVAIGGINRDRAAEALDAGANAVAVYSAIMQDSDPGVAAKELALLFNRNSDWPRGRVLTVAGSDSGGGAGIQADLKTITLLGSYGMSALTALTAQNTRGVHGVQPVPPEFIVDQIEAVLTDIGADTAKTGMLFSAASVARVAQALARYPLLTVVDPVIVAKGGEALLQESAVDSMITHLLPQAYLLTPNLPEAEALTGRKISTEADMTQAARDLQQLGARNVLVKGGHLAGEAVDVLLEGDAIHRFPGKRYDTTHTHGTGCSYAAAISTLLAQGLPLTEAVRRAKAFIAAAIRTAPGLGSGQGPINHYRAALELMHATGAEG